MPALNCPVCGWHCLPTSKLDHLTPTPSETITPALSLAALKASGAPRGGAHAVDLAPAECDSGDTQPYAQGRPGRVYRR